MLEDEIRRRLAQKPVLVMTHIVIGYPSFRESWALARGMVDAGVDLIELQIPFSEPMADGPVILAANQKALEAGASVSKCFEFARELSGQVAIPLVFMSYYNIPFKYGAGRFAAEARAAGVSGAIVPDLPPEEAPEYLEAMRAQELDPVLLFSPNTPEERMQAIAAQGSGFLYCVARKGVTGARTDFSAELAGYLARARRASQLPLAVGFGVKNRADVEFLRGRAEIAVVGSESLRVLNASGLRAATDFVRSLTGAPPAS